MPTEVRNIIIEMNSKVNREILKCSSGYDERGLLDIEFHPNYTDNRLFYLYYNVLKDQNTDYIRISEMKVNENVS